MTQNNLYMEDDELRLYVDVQPIFIDELENSKNEAAASANSAAESASEAQTWLNNIISFKTNLEIYYAQVMNNLVDWYNSALTEFSDIKDQAVSALQTKLNNIETAINTTYQDIINSFQLVVQDYINQAKNYAEQATEAVDNRVSIDHLNQSKALETGSISTDLDVLENIKKYAHSSFDRLKWTDLGTITVTDDGIISDVYRTTRLVQASIRVPAPKKEIIFRGKGVISSANNFADGVQILLAYRQDNRNRSIQTKVGYTYVELIRFDSSISPNLRVSLGQTLKDGDTVEVEVIVTPTKLTGNVWINGGDKKTNTVNGNWLYSTGDITAVALGSIENGGNYYWTGSIDAKSIELITDGITTFLGNKTGIDIIKSDDYTVLPATNSAVTITEDGIASGFSANDYLTTFQNLNGNLLKIQIPFKTNDVTKEQDLISSNYIKAKITESSKLDFTVSNGTNDFTVSTSVNDLVNDTEYIAEFIYNRGSSYTSTIKIYNTDGTIFDTIIGTNPNSFGIPSDSQTIILGSGTNPLDGSIDLNGVKFYQNYDLKYQPCLKIPYTESKIGAKIVNAIYRLRVQDMYEQYGYAPYYTLSDTDFTLPMGDIYGMIENLRKLILDRTNVNAE